MTAWMPPPLNRKRPAPGASPIGNIQMPNQQFPVQQPVGNTDYMWNQAPADSRIYPEGNFNNMAAYGSMPNPQQPNPTNYSLQQPPNTQLARRPHNTPAHTQLIPAVQRTPFLNPNEWAMSEDVGYDPTVQNGGLAENDSIDRLEERAAAAKRDAQSKRKQIPPFVQKLNSFLDDGKNTELIRWSDRGDSFVVLDEDEFAKTLIPELFKHNNYASFVRQLNMYGFHKRVGLSDNSMKASERKNKSPSEYYNPYFKRGHPNLLWLINKPKNPQKKGKGGRPKQEEGVEDSDDDNKDSIEDVYGYGQEIPRAISLAPSENPSGPLALTIVQKQLRDIQNQQTNISQMLARLKRENENLYAQADSFSQQHNRHETSINAILSFLATIYNRSLDGQNGGADLRMFSGAVNHDQHQQGSVVDLSNLNQGTPNANMSPMRRAPRLLMAPGQQGSSNSGNSGHISNVSTPSTQGGNKSINYSRPTPTPTQTPQSGAIEEVFENSPGRSPESTTTVKGDPSNDDSPSRGNQNSTPTPNQGQGQPRRNIVDLINSTNANVSPSQKDMEFPEVLRHYQIANGQSPLTSQQRDQMLDLISSTSEGAQSGGLNALSSPSQMPVPNFDQLNYSQAELERLMQLQQEQDNKISRVSHMLGPLTPGGTIPGVDQSNSYGFPNGGQSPNVDLDQFLDTGAYYNADVGADAAMGGGGYNFDGTGVYGNVNDAMAPELDFSMGGMGGMDGTGVGGMNTNGTSPSSTAADGLNSGDASLQTSREGSPKRRRVA